jgi:purine nucleosidase
LPEGRLPIWIDTDPGIDDAIALILAVRSPELELLGVSTVNGNVEVERATLNALRVLELAGSGAPVWQGAERSLLGELHRASFHGTDGLGGLLFEPSRRPAEAGFAPQAMAEHILGAPGKVTLVALGPLTNLALALNLAPAFAARVERIVIMGGAMFTEGNVTPSAEFNTHCDPEAAHRVLGSGIPQTWVPLDATGHALLPVEWSAKMAAEADPLRRFVGRLTLFYAQSHKAYYGTEGSTLHDPLTVASLLEPGLLETRPALVRVELGGSLSRGRTVADLLGTSESQGEPNAEVALAADSARFLELVQARIGG